MRTDMQPAGGLARDDDESGRRVGVRLIVGADARVSDQGALTVASTNSAMAANVVCAALSPRRKSSSVKVT